MHTCVALTGMACTVVLALQACHSRSADDSVIAAPTSTRSTGLASVVGVDSPRAVTSGVRASHIQPNESFTALMSRLPAAQQAAVREWYHRIDAPPMRGATAGQVAWMRERHYPMPGEIARAATISTSELMAEARSGDTTAQILSIVRGLDDAERHQGQSGTSGMDSTARATFDATWGFMQEVLGSGSPFAGYLYPVYDYEMNRILESSAGLNANVVERDPARKLAGLVWASQFGDVRATLLLQDPHMQAVDAFSAGMAVQLMLSQALHANPGLFASSVVQMPTQNN